MKKFFTVVGFLFLVAILAGGGFVAYAVYQGRALDASSKAYVEANVPVIVATWSKQELLKRASPQLLKVLGEHPGQLDRMFHKLSALGAMQSFGHVQGESSILYNPSKGKSTTASYTAKAVFVNGEVDINVRLILQSGQWKFLGFYVHSPVFLPGQEQGQEQSA